MTGNHRKRHTAWPWLAAAVFFLWVSTAAGAESTPDFFLSVSTGIERLGYSEKDAELNLDSRAASVNWVAMIHAEKNWKGLNVSATGVFPVAAGRSMETWRRNGEDVQTNDLRYSLSRMDGRLGYAVRPWLIPCAGVRWAEAVQKRDSIMLGGSPYAGEFRETVESSELSLGLKGGIPLNRNLCLSWLAAWYTPLSIKVANSMYPGTVIRSVPSYGIETEFEAVYRISPRFSCGLMGLLGRIHRSGSPWVPAGIGSIKYPQNDTTLMSLSLMVRGEF